MLYVVSGFMRTGTSMMMQSLEAGGMEAVYSRKRDADMNARWGEPDYRPNDNYYELDADDYLRGDMAERYAGKLIKCLWGGALRLPPVNDGYRIIFMRRPVEEIRVSLLAFFGSDNAATQFPDFDRMMDTVIAILSDRRSVHTLDVVQYHDMLRAPEETLTVLDWPIDVKRAAAVPVREKARFANA